MIRFVFTYWTGEWYADPDGLPTGPKYDVASVVANSQPEAELVLDKAIPHWRKEPPKEVAERFHELCADGESAGMALARAITDAAIEPTLWPWG